MYVAVYFVLYSGLNAQGITAEVTYDFQLQNTELIFDGNTLSGIFYIEIIDDPWNEDTETFALHLVNGDGVVIAGTNEAIVSILDNDGMFS